MGIRNLFRKSSTVRHSQDQKKETVPEKNDALKAKEPQKPMRKADLENRIKAFFAESAKPVYLESDIGKMRYAFEHKHLKDQFFANPEKTVRLLLSEDGFFGMASFIAGVMSCDNPYHPGNTRIDLTKWNRHINLITIRLPEPECEPLCHRIHIFFSNDFSDLGYYTVEHSTADGASVCGWDHDVHMNYRHIAAAAGSETGKAAMAPLETYIMIKLHADSNRLNPEPDDFITTGNRTEDDRLSA